jgi:hypothetical protein
MLVTLVTSRAITQARNAEKHPRGVVGDLGVFGQTGTP